MTVIPSTAMPRSDTAGPALALVVVRPAGADDRAALAAMVERASDDTLWRRFHGAGSRVVERELDLAPGEVKVHRPARRLGLGHDLVEPGRRVALRAQEAAGRADETITRVGCHTRSIAI